MRNLKNLMLHNLLSEVEFRDDFKQIPQIFFQICRMRELRAKIACSPLKVVEEEEVVVV